MNNILKSDLTIGLFVLLFIIVIAFGSFYQNKPPRVVTKDAPAELFSAERAMAHLPYICTKPHSIGTTEHLRIRNYLIDILKSMGLTQLAQINGTNPCMVDALLVIIYQTVRLTPVFSPRSTKQ